MDRQLARLDATGQAELVAKGEVTPAELVTAAIERIEALNGAVNAVIHRSFERGLAEATEGTIGTGVFRGVPFLMKDLWPAAAGDPWQLGNKGLARAGHVATEDSNLTRRYREAGFVLLGRTNTPELGLVATTEPESYGPTRNPWALDHGPGGSSGGAASAVAAGMIPAANASDGGGSIRIPAALCGLVGLKPSRGRVSMGPHQEEWSVSAQHVVCHTVRDCAGILDATAIPFPGDGVIAPRPGRPWADEVGSDPGVLRIGFTDQSDTADVAPSLVDAVSQVGDLLESMGHVIDRNSPPALAQMGELSSHFLTSWGVGARHSLSTISEMLGRPVDQYDVEPSTWQMSEMAAGVSATEYLAAQMAFGQFRRDMLGWWAEGWDLLLTPTTAMPAPRLGELVSTDADPLAPLIRSTPYAAFTAPFNTTGQPAISIPMGHDADGLPLGIQLVAAYGREDLLIAVASQLETELDWASKRAPLHP